MDTINGHMDAHRERMDALDRTFEALKRKQEKCDRLVENTERLLALAGERIDRLDRIEVRLNELFAEISEQLRNMNKR